MTSGSITHDDLMAATSSHPLTPSAQLGAIDRLLFWSLSILSAMIFWNVGWMAAAPVNPRGAVSFSTWSSPFVSLLECGALACVVAGGATLLLGRRLPNMGTFAAAVGLATVSLRGETAAYLLLEQANAHSALSRTIALRLGLETLAWLGVLAVTFVLCRGIENWCFGDETQSPRRDRQAPSDPADGASKLAHAAVAAAAFLAGVFLLSSGHQARAVEHGQACFVAAASAVLACYLAHLIKPTAGYRWSAMGIAVVSVAGYVVSAWTPLTMDSLLTVPRSPFLRILPIQLASASMAAVIWMSWHSLTSVRPADDAEQSSPDDRRARRA